MALSLETVALRACRHFLVPVARFLLNVGVSYREFAEISKLAFVQVASDEFGIRGRKTNMSRVSVMTGLNRKEIRKIRDRLESEDWSLDPGLSKASGVLTRWYTDPNYLGPKGFPVWLPYESEDGGKSFCKLVREIGGDVPPGAMLRELERAGCVKEVKAGTWKAVKRQYAPAGVDLFQVQRFGECLHDLADTISKNYLEHADGPNRRFEFRAWSDSVDPRVLGALHRLVATQGKPYLESVDDFLADHQVHDHLMDDSEAMRCGVGIYYFESPAENMP